MSEPEMQVTDVKSWKERRKSFLFKLPSGFVAVLKPVSTELVLRHGNIPDTLTPIVEKYFTGKVQEPASLEDVTKNLDFINLVCELSFVDPKFSMNPSDFELGPLDLDQEDKFAVFSLLNQPSQVLEEFREEQKSVVESL